MRILILSPQNPYPAVDGGKIHILNLVTELAASGQSVAIFFLHDDEPRCLEGVRHFASCGVKAYPFRLDTSDSVFRMAGSIGREMPFKMAKYFDGRAFRFLTGAVEEFRPEIVQAHHAHMGRYGLELKRRGGIPIVLREHNIEYGLVEQFWRSARNPIVRAAARWQYTKTKKYETHLWGRFDRVVFISAVDEKLARGDAPRIRSAVVGVGVDPRRFVRCNSSAKPRSAIFSGCLRTVQNLESIVWFIRCIWPRVRRCEPRAELYLTGGGELLLLQRLATDAEGLKKQGVIPLGFVEDINRTISECDVFVSPTRMGSGVRIKVLNAMVLGMAVVCTPLDAESIVGVRHNEHLYVAGSPEQFADAVLKLFADEPLRRRLGANASRLIEREFTWRRCAEKFTGLYKEILTGESASDQ